MYHYCLVYMAVRLISYRLFSVPMLWMDMGLYDPTRTLALSSHLLNLQKRAGAQIFTRQFVFKKI